MAFQFLNFKKNWLIDRPRIVERGEKLNVYNDPLGFYVNQLNLTKVRVVVFAPFLVTFLFQELFFI